MASKIYSTPRVREFTSSGTVLNGGKLYFYLAGTTTPATVYTSSAMTTAHAHPVLATTAGLFPAIWLAAGVSYDVTCKNSAGAVQWTALNYSDALTAAEVGPALTADWIGQAFYPISDAETTAGLTDNDLTHQYIYGDVRRYGASASASESVNATAIQVALDANGTIYLSEMYQIDAVVLMNDNNFIQGNGRGTGLTASHAGSIIKGKSVTTYATTNVRRYSGGGRDFTITGPGVGTVGSVALDMRGCTMFKWWGLLASGVETGVKQGDGYATFYNEYHGCDLSGVGTGYDNSTLGNENKVFGGRVNDCDVGTVDDDNSCNTYIGLAIEAFTTTGHSVSPTAASLLTRFIGSRLENIPTVGTGILVGATAQDTLIESPYITGLTTDINDGGLRTSVLFPRGASGVPYLKFNGGSGVAKILKVAVVRDVASLASATFRQEGPITVTGATVGDAITVTLPAAWPNNIIVGVPIISATDTVYLPIYNPSGGAVDPSSGTFVFSIMEFT